MKIVKITENKKKYLSLLLLADEQEDMIDKYLERGEMFALFDGDDVVAECVVTNEGSGVYEIKNIAVSQNNQGKGFGRRLVEYVLKYYTECKIMLVGTGDSPKTLGFYKRLGFVESHRIKNFFTENYAHPMYEDDVLLQDMIYLKHEK